MNIISIQHSGTRLIAEKFDLGDELALKDSRKGFHVGHISEGQMPYILGLLAYPTIIPMRHPYLVAESWNRRGKPESELIRNYGYLIEKIDLFVPYYVCVDTDERNSQIEKINRALDLTLSEKWPIINSKCNTYDLSYKDIEPTPTINGMVQKYSEFFSRYY